MPIVLCTVTQSCPTLCDPMDYSTPAPRPSSSPKVCPSSCPLHQWCHPNISSSDALSSFCPQSFLASSFQMSQLFTSSGQHIRVLASTSVLLVNIQDWLSLGWTGWISLQSKKLSRVFSSTTLQKHQFFGAQLSSQSNSHIHIFQFSSVAQLCPTLCNPMNRSMPGLPVHNVILVQILHFKGERRESPRGLRCKVFHTKEELVLFFSFGRALNLSGVYLLHLAQWQ